MNKKTSANIFIKKTIELASNADDNEVPVAAVIVKDNEIIAEATNTRERDKDVFGHAEINAIKIAQKKLNTWNLSSCQIYVSLEPCSMCAGAISQAHISEIYFGAFDYKAGACGSKYMIFPENMTIEGGIMENEAKALLTKFFSSKR